MAGTPKLIVLSSQFRGKQFELTNDMYTVGRSEERDICIKDPSLSSYHCDIICKGDSFIVRDNNSTNGTRVNDKMISEQVLMNSDIIQFGGIEVLFDADSKEGSRSTTTQRTTTGITITDIDPDTVNLGTAPEQSSPSDRKERFILIAVIAILLIAVLALGGFLFQKGN